MSSSKLRIGLILTLLSGICQNFADQRVILPVRSNPELGSYYEGDILEAPLKISRSAVKDSLLWPGRTMVYDIDPAFTPRERAYIQKAMDEISSSSCVTFRPGTTGDYVYFTKDSKPSCSSFVGRIGGRQPLFLGEACFLEGHGTVMHEIMHALGFHHEQSRPDRDEYVTIKENNIEPSMIGNFKKEEGTRTWTPYDYTSILHYPNDAFGKKLGDITMEVKPSYFRFGELTMGQRRRLTNVDSWKLMALYQCHTMWNFG